MHSAVRELGSSVTFDADADAEADADADADADPRLVSLRSGGAARAALCARLRCRTLVGIKVKGQVAPPIMLRKADDAEGSKRPGARSRPPSVRRAPACCYTRRTTTRSSSRCESGPSRRPRTPPPTPPTTTAWPRRPKGGACASCSPAARGSALPCGSTGPRSTATCAAGRATQ